MPKAKKKIIDSFDFHPGRVLARKYEVIGLLGAGWEGEVYLVCELATGIEHAAKFFFPQRNLRNRNLITYAKKLHKLRHCPILIQYHTHETITFNGAPISFLVSDYVEGEILSEFLKRQPGGRLDYFQGMHLLYALASGMERIHHLKEYHGDLHTDNVIVQRRGLGFDIKVLDLYHWNAPKAENIHDDVCDLIRLYYDSIGGQKHYARQPADVKQIICGLKRTMILKKFRTAGQLREHLETFQWGD
ncbi:MAG: Dot/Icm T4SS effector protein kinase CoxK1 [Gammaproteobacteria bacterium]|nr:MAG: Dot/Icm T4SS effector protein kinase CoxK1 [Gammaproteobacteria bacterium]